MLLKVEREWGDAKGDNKQGSILFIIALKSEVQDPNYLAMNPRSITF